MFMRNETSEDRWVSTMARTALDSPSSRPVSRLASHGSGTRWRFAPEVFERVELARFGVEQVDHDRAVVEQDPAALVVAFDAHPLVAQLAFEHVVDFVADGVQLPAAVAGDEHEVVELGRQLLHVEHDDILAAVVVGRARSGQRELQAAFVASFEIRQGFGDGGTLVSDMCR